MVFVRINAIVFGTICAQLVFAGFLQSKDVKVEHPRTHGVRKQAAVHPANRIRVHPTALPKDQWYNADGSEHLRYLGGRRYMRPDGEIFTGPPDPGKPLVKPMWKEQGYYPGGPSTKHTPVNRPKDRHLAHDPH